MDFTGIQTFFQIGVVGIAASYLLEYLTKKYSATASKLITLGVSVVLGAAYWFFSGTAWWASMLGVLAAASTFYALFLKKPTSQ